MPVLPPRTIPDRRTPALRGGKEGPSAGLWISVAIHAAVLGLGAVLLQTRPQFAVEAGRGSVAVHLVAAASDPEEETPAASEAPVAEETPPPEPPKPDDLLVPETPAAPVPPTPESNQAVKPSLPQPRPVRTVSEQTPERGDGSSPQPGKDATTVSSGGGAIVDGKPDYLRNPAPVYPEECRRARQEGLVLLQVIVNVDGRSDRIEVRRGSGFPPLDEAAVKAVSAWRFRPATLGGIKVKSRVMVPVRFRLDS